MLADTMLPIESKLIFPYSTDTEAKETSDHDYALLRYATLYHSVWVKMMIDE